jgi:hypothetical protein
MHFAITSPVGAVQPPVPCRVAKESAMPWHFCHMHAPHKKLRVPEWDGLAWMMERALNAGA